MKNKTKVAELDATLVQMQKQSASNGVSVIAIQRFGSYKSLFSNRKFTTQFVNFLLLSILIALQTR